MLHDEEIRISLEAEEMAELAVNGQMVGAEFWAPQVFEIKEMLQPGKNELDVIVTGSLANLYGNRCVCVMNEVSRNYVKSGKKAVLMVSLFVDEKRTETGENYHEKISNSAAFVSCDHDDRMPGE